MDTWTKEAGAYKTWDTPNDAEDKEFWRLAPESSTFHIGQNYDKHPAQVVSCLGCGGDKFVVGRGDYYTAIKCPACEWEQCIHEG